MEEREEFDEQIDTNELMNPSENEEHELDVPHDALPKELFVIPLTRRPFFPGMAAPLVIEPGPYYEALKMIAKSEHKLLGLFMTKKEDVDIYSLKGSDFHKVGVVARILRIIPIEQGGAQVILNMEKRVKAKSMRKKGPHTIAKVLYHTDPVRKQAKVVKAYTISIITTIKELLKLNPLFKEELQIFLGHSDFTEPGKLADFAVALTTASRDELQKVLESFTIQERIDKALVLLKKELDLSKLQSSINQKIEATVSKSQREFFLKEQLKAIKKELGLDKDDKTLDRQKFLDRIKGKTLPEDVKKVIDDELEKLNFLEMQSAEYSICRNYLDWLTNVPWDTFTKDQLDLKHAETVLDEDHYGLEDVKTRILEFISVGKLSGGMKSNILCFVGPPGVGKTSIGKSIARALDRKFYRFSVGGMRDEAEIKGHRRTYVGAMPGKMIQALKFCEAMNPVIMLDEVDKLGSSYQGDPASALLEVLDPEQNKEFLDHYLDVRCDLSDVLFIITANVLDTIPGPLRDRMDTIRLSGYVLEEKVEIASRYLVPKHREQMGLKTSDVKFSKTVLRKIINEYAREAGVRSLEKNIKKILRKVAVKVVKRKKGAKKAFTVTEKNLSEFLGPPIFTSDRIFQKTPVGVSTGLAWTSMGGAVLFIETVKNASDKTQMKLTGQAGDVMKESSQIAWSYLMSKVKSYVPNKKFFEKMEIHLHIPEGATPKDGPSAGITMVTALLSLLLNKPVRQDLGMTGELTLSGKVLAIGGVKEKLIAAKRSKLKVVIFPEDNRRDIAELPAYLKTNIDIRFVKHYDDVYKIAFPHVAKSV